MYVCLSKLLMKESNLLYKSPLYIVIDRLYQNTCFFPLKVSRGGGGICQKWKSTILKRVEKGYKFCFFLTVFVHTTSR